mgnify:CR=1 FL=1
MTERERAIHICKNLQHTYDNMKDTNTLISANPMFKPTRASKATIKRKLDEVKRKHKL